MPNAVTHILVAILFIDLFRDYVVKKRAFPLYLVLIGGVAGLMPDIDILIIWLFDLNVHRLYTHSFMIPVLFLLVGLVAYRYRKMLGKLFFVVSAGWVTHILLDGLLSGSVIPFWPVSTMAWGMNLLPGSTFGGTLYAGIDAILLVVWLVHEYFQHNIKDYI
tara:strand:+ start:1660 stop:2145 length:486 start_codon:yes stop_codon:yes gene_type:complete